MKGGRGGRGSAYCTQFGFTPNNESRRRRCSAPRSCGILRGLGGGWTKPQTSGRVLILTMDWTNLTSGQSSISASGQTKAGGSGTGRGGFRPAVDAIVEVERKAVGGRGPRSEGRGWDVLCCGAQPWLRRRSCSECCVRWKIAPSPLLNPPFQSTAAAASEWD
jgi:hypothetical protein